LTFPHRLRYRLARDHALCRAIVGVSVRTVLGFLRHVAHVAGVVDGRGGAVSIVQRFGGLTAEGFSLEGWPALLVIRVSALVFLAYYVCLEWWFGATLGKFVAGAWITGVDGGRIDFRRSLIRNLLRVIDALPLNLVAAILVLSTKRQRLGDIYAFGPHRLWISIGRGSARPLHGLAIHRNEARQDRPAAARLDRVRGVRYRCSQSGRCSKARRTSARSSALGWSFAMRAHACRHVLSCEPVSERAAATAAS